LLLQVLNAACEACQKSIEGAKGKMSVKEAARAVSERDDRLLAEKMEALEAANREVSYNKPYAFGPHYITNAWSYVARLYGDLYGDEHMRRQQIYCVLIHLLM
jgi:hypothetical protein